MGGRRVWKDTAREPGCRRKHHIHDGCGDDFETLWRTYFDLDTDYIRIAGILSENEVLSRVYNNAVGIRIMRQEPFETLCSFIISQNNNIPRIKGIISKLCENFGDEIAPGYYTFPTAERLAALSEENLAPLRGRIQEQIYTLCRADGRRRLNRPRIPQDGSHGGGKGRA